MKTVHYLAKLGIAPKANRDFLISTILVFAPYNKVLSLYPNATWLEHPVRRNWMLRWLDGDVELIYDELKKAPIYELVAMLEDCFDALIWDFGLEKFKHKKLLSYMEKTETWVYLFNKYNNLSVDDAWDHKFEVITAFSTENRCEGISQELVEICEEYICAA